MFSNAKVLCKEHGLQKVVGFEKSRVMVLECGCKRGKEL
jgi:hypothetical protein